MSDPKVTVCIDVHDYEAYLPQAIESVLRQTLRDLQIVIVDDCSADGSFDVACRYAQRDPRIVARRHPANRGMVRNRNACLALARGEYVKFVHADDYLCAPHALERMAAALDANPGASLVASAMRYVSARGGCTGVSSHFAGDQALAGPTVITRCLLEQKNLIGGPSAVMFRRSRAARGFDERYFHAADLEMWFHLLEQGCLVYLADPLAAYRRHPGQQTEKDKRTLTQYDDQRALLATYLERHCVRLGPRMRRFLWHEAVRRTIQQCRRISAHEAAIKIVRQYGRWRYVRDRPWCVAFRRMAKLSSRWQDRHLPPRRNVLGPSAKLALGVNVAGFLRGEYGTGESSRALSRAVAASGLPYVLLNVQARDHRNADDSLGSFARANPYRVNLMAFSFDYTRRFYRDMGARYFEGRRNIAVWYWEMEAFPVRYHGNFDYYDEIWATSEYCRRAFAAVSPAPVYKITYPLSPNHTAAADRGAFGLSPRSCVFLFTFDYHSTIARKNPLGLLRAFRQAFRPDDEVVLVLKSINSHAHPEDRNTVGRAADGLRVLMLDPHLTGQQMAALAASADCYVSVHRSEGFGLGMAQAMSLGKPVIATGYSGNLDFMNRENSLLVNWKPAELEETCGVYPRGGHWAEPDAEHAAELMRWVYTHRAEAAALGERARCDVGAALDPARTAAEIRARVTELAG